MAQRLLAAYFAVRTFLCCAPHIPRDGKIGKRHSLGPDQKLNPSYFSIANIDHPTMWKRLLFLLMDQKTETLNSDPKKYYSSSNSMQNAAETQTLQKSFLFKRSFSFPMFKIFHENISVFSNHKRKRFLSKAAVFAYQHR